MRVIRKLIRVIIVLAILLFLANSTVKYINKYIDRTLYPTEYIDIVNKYSEEYELDPLLVLSVIRVESKFDKNARSNKDARGLMQITPSTGRWAAEKLKIENYDDEKLFEPETNIRIGCWYLDNLRTQFDHKMQLVLAAYNGGSGNVSKWLENSEYSDDGEYLKKIPFEETENYVKKVFTSYEKYMKIYSEKTQDEG